MLPRAAASDMDSWIGRLPGGAARYSQASSIPHRETGEIEQLQAPVSVGRCRAPPNGTWRRTNSGNCKAELPGPGNLKLLQRVSVVG